MNYLSTRGHPDRKRFCEILLEGLAPDGGLYLPETYPQVDTATLAKWRALPYAELAFEILSLYIDDIPPADLKAICAKTYTAEVFGTDEIVPLRELEDGVYLEALSNGPTLAFKDMAMQLLGNLFEYELARRGDELNILGATSGDTGSAAEYAMRGKKGVRVFMTSPDGRMSPFQQAQMFSLQDANIHNIAITGVFDDCQDIVKAVSNDLGFKRKYRIGTVNSINWARLLAQVVYYFAGYFQATGEQRQAGELHRALGQLRQCLRGPRGAHDGPADPARWWSPPTRTTCSTSSSAPACTACARPSTRTKPPARRWTSRKASNFERFVFDLVGRDAARTRALFEDDLGRAGQLRPERRPGVRRRPRRASASPAAAARTPTAWPPSATPTSASPR